MSALTQVLPRPGGNVLRVARGLLGAFALFAASFALHIVGGALDLGWLFAVAVALIFVFATAFPAVAWLLAGGPGGPAQGILFGVGATAGLALTASALWAANDRSLAWWQLPLAAALVAAATALLLGAIARWRGGPSAEPGPAPS